LGRTYEPVSLLTTERVNPVSVSLAVTSTPGNTAPLWSMTVPLIWAVDCAQTIDEQLQSNQIPAKLNRTTLFIVHLQPT